MEDVSQDWSYELEMTKINKIQRFHYLGTLVTDDGKCDIETRRRFGIAKDAYQKIIKVLRSKKIWSETENYWNSAQYISSYMALNSLQFPHRIDGRCGLTRGIRWIPWPDHGDNQLFKGNWEQNIPLYLEIEIYVTHYERWLGELNNRRGQGTTSSKIRHFCKWQNRNSEGYCLDL